MSTPASSSPPATPAKSLVRSGFAPINGLEMYYEVHGSGPPLISIHAGAGMANVFSSLTRRHTLIAMDLQGHGRTADIGRPLSFEQHADDVAALMNHLGVAKADILGECWGGTTALVLATRHPHLVRREAIYGASIRVAGGPPFPADHPAFTFPRNAYRQVAPRPDDWPTLYRKLSDMRWPGFTPDQFKDLGIPVLIGIGDHDFIPIADAVELFQMIPDVQLAVIPDAGHFLLSANPEKFLSLVEGFLTANSLPPTYATYTTGYIPGVNQ